MSYIFEIYYHSPVDCHREEKIVKEVAGFGGKLTFREEPENHIHKAICLTFEFDKIELAEKAASAMRSLGEHVEGPMDYGTT